MDCIRFFVPGKPACAGSKRAFLNKKSGKIIMVPDDERSMPWRTNVQGHAMQEMANKAKIATEAVQLSITFTLARPKNHYRTGKHAGQLKDGAPVLVTTKPDLTKIVRAIEDALTGICWTDDNQVARHNTMKRYANPNETPGAEIGIAVL